MKTVVITGADGFIGHHLVRYMTSQGYTVYAIVIENSPTQSRLEGLEKVNVVVSNESNYETLADRLPKSPSAFIHLAWAGVSPEDRNCMDIQMKNVNLCLNAVKLAATINAKRFILPGSTLEYAYCGAPINERACPSPQNAYGAAKLASRYLCASQCEELKIPFIYTVITGIYSPDRTDNNIIFYTITSLLKGEKPSFTKLEQLWDYVHIDDVIRALYLVATSGKDKAFYTIGHGDNWPLYNYIYQIRNMINPELPLGIGEIPYKNGLCPSSCVDLTALQSDTGFEPKVPFEEGIRQVIDTVAEQLRKKG